MTTTRQPTDATLRNVRAAKTRHATLTERVRTLERTVRALLRTVGRLDRDQITMRHVR